MWVVIIHLTLVLSGVLFALMDRIAGGIMEPNIQITRSDPASPISWLYITSTILLVESAFAKPSSAMKMDMVKPMPPSTDTAVLIGASVVASLIATRKGAQ